MIELPAGFVRALRGARREPLEDAPLAPHPTFRIGGHARVLVAAHSPQEVVAAVRRSVEAGVRWTVLGGGSNVLVSDEGFPGVVVLVRASRVSLHGTEIEAEAGADLGRVVTGSAWAGLGDLTFCAGIPGTVGGAVAGNGGALGLAVGSLIVTGRTLSHARPKVC